MVGVTPCIDKAAPPHPHPPTPIHTRPGPTTTTTTGLEEAVAEFREAERALRGAGEWAARGRAAGVDRGEGAPSWLSPAQPSPVLASARSRLRLLSPPPFLHPTSWLQGCQAFPAGGGGCERVGDGGAAEGAAGHAQPRRNPRRQSPFQGPYTFPLKQVEAYQRPYLFYVFQGTTKPADDLNSSILSTTWNYLFGAEK